MAVRDEQKAAAACASARLEMKNVTIHKLDLTDRLSIEAFAEEACKNDIHVLINNAGVLHQTGPTFIHGMESTLLTNHIGPAYLTQLLLPALHKTREKCLHAQHSVRIVNVGSRLEKNGKLDFHSPFLQLIKNGTTAEQPFGGWSEYSNSKNMNLLWSNALQRRNPQIVINTVTPGVVNTELSRNSPWWLLYLTYPLRALLLRSPAQGADAVVHAAVSPEVTSGGVLRADKGVVIRHSRENNTAEEESARMRTEEIVEYWQRRVATRLFA